MKQLTKNINIINAINIIFINNNLVIVTNIVTTTDQNRLELIIEKLLQKILTLCEKEINMWEI